MKKFILFAGAVLALASCEPIEINLEPRETDICKRMYFTASVDDTTLVNEVFTICPTTLVGSEAKDSTELYWAAADQDLELVSIDSVQFFFN